MAAIISASAVVSCSRRKPHKKDRKPMALSMYQASVPVFVQGLGALTKLLDKAEAYATAKKIDQAVLMGCRLAPDMFPLSRQVQTVSDFAKGSSARLAGVEVPGWSDNEKTFAELKDRIRKTLDFVQSFKPGQIDGSEERDVTIKLGGNPVTFKGQPYLLHFVLPNFYFHSTTAYAILRHNGVDVGKRDFLGQVPGMPA
jgi:uncharacterized protein